MAYDRLNPTDSTIELEWALSLSLISGAAFEIIAESLGNYVKIPRIKIEYLGQGSCDQ